MPVEGINGILNVESAALHAPQVGVANTNPQHILSVGSNLYVSGDSSDVLTVDGNVVCEGVKVGLIEIIPSYDLEAVANVGNSTSNTIQFTNPGTGIVTTGNVTVGKDLNVTGNLNVLGTTTTIDTENLRVKDPIIELGKDNPGTGDLDLGLVMTRPSGSSNVAVIFDEDTDTLKIGYTQNNASDTDITMDSTPLSVNVNGNLSVTSNAEVGTANLFVDTTTGRVGIGKTDPGAALDVVGDVEISSNLAVDTNTLFVDSVGNKVGIGTTNPKTALDINGDVAALSQQPPSNLTYNTATSSIAGHGDYVIDTSRNQFNSSSGNSTSAFDPMGNWWNSDSDYTSGDANISGTFSSLTDSDSTVHYGAWAALELPYTTKLRYVIASQRAHSTGPSSFPSVVKVFGASAIGGTLYLINTYSVPTASSYSGVEIPVNASSRYKAYYFSFPSLQGGSATVLQISRINLFTETIGIESSRFKATTGDFTGNVGIGTTSPAEKLDVQGSALITGSTYGIKSTGTLGSDKSEGWYRLLIGGIRSGASSIRTECKLQLQASGLHQSLTFDFNHMISLSQTSGNSFNLLGNDHYISRVGITKLRLADAGSNQFALDMYIDHDVVPVERDWTITLYTEGGSLISEATTFLEKITATPSASIELDTDTSIFGIVGSTTSKTLIMHENGNVGIGTTNPSTKLHVYGSGTRTGGDDAYGSYCQVGSNGSIWRNYTENGGRGAGIHITDVAILPGDRDGGIDTAGETKLGSATQRWGQIYSTNSTISTSDRNKKQDINDITESERKVATKITDLFKTFRFKDDVSKKGDDARLHNGVIAQDLIEAFESEGLDAHRYGLFCYDEKWTVDGEHELMETTYEKDGISEYTNEDGEVVKYTSNDEGVEAVKRWLGIVADKNTPGAVFDSGTYSIRYEELLCFVVSALAKNEDLQAEKVKVATLETQVADLLARVQTLEGA